MGKSVREAVPDPGAKLYGFGIEIIMQSTSDPDPDLRAKLSVNQGPRSGSDTLIHKRPRWPIEAIACKNDEQKSMRTPRNLGVIKAI